MHFRYDKWNSKRRENTKGGFHERLLVPFRPNNKQIRR